MRISLLLPALAFAGLSTVAWADDETKPPMTPDETTPKESPESTPKDSEKSTPTVINFAEANARFEIVRDPSGTTLVRLATPNARIARDPVVVVETEKGPREVVLVPVPGQTGTWRLTSELPAGRSPMMRIMVGERTYTSPWTYVATSSRTRYVARHGGWVVPFESCSANVEIVQDVATGSLTIYSPEDVKIIEAPVVTITETEGPATVSVIPVNGQPGVWKVTHASFKTRNFAGSIRLMVNGKPCTAPLAFSSSRGGRMVNINGAPPFEVVRRDNGSYVFYAVDETWDGKPYTITNPQVVYTTPQGPRTVTLQPVPDEPRAWELVGAGADFQPTDARLRFTLFGKTLEGNAGLSGLGLNLK